MLREREKKNGSNESKRKRNAVSQIDFNMPKAISNQLKMDGSNSSLDGLSYIFGANLTSTPAGESHKHIHNMKMCYHRENKNRISLPALHEQGEENVLLI